MTTVKSFTLGTILGAGLVFVALQYHLVQSREGFRLIPRSPQHSIGLAYADIRDWDSARWADRPELMKALVAHGSTDLVTQSVTGNVMDSVSSAIETSTGGGLDQVRELLKDSSSDSSFDRLFESSGSMTIPSMDDLSPSTFRDEDGSSVPFPSEARRRNETVDTALHEPNRDRESAVDDIFRSGSARADDLRASARDNAGSVDSTSTFDEDRFDSSRRYNSQPRYPASDESEFRESNSDDGSQTSQPDRFGTSYDQPSRTNTSSQPSGNDLFNETESPVRSPSSAGGSPQDNESDIMGMFEEVSETLEREAEENLSSLANESRRNVSDRVNERVEAADRYVRDRVRQSVPDRISSMFPEESTSTLTPFRREEPSATPGDQRSADENLPAALRALRDGFDPFVD